MLSVRPSATFITTCTIPLFLDGAKLSNSSYTYTKETERSITSVHVYRCVGDAKGLGTALSSQLGYPLGTEVSKTLLRKYLFGRQGAEGGKGWGSLRMATYS